MKMIFFSKMRKILCTIEKCKKKFIKFFSVFEITMFEPVSGVCPNCDENLYDQQSTFYQTAVRFSKSVLKKGLYDNQLTTFLGLNNFLYI